MEGSNQAAPVDIENPYIPLETSMRSELGSLSPLSSSSLCCIYKVPQRLRCVNEKAYTPQVVSIGPLHHGTKALEAMEEHKKRYLQDFLCRTDVSLEEFIKKIRDKEARLRSCYPETIKFSSDQFVRIILVDAAFIIELLLRSRGHRVTENKYKDHIFNKPRLFLDLVPDMYLLENQLPFFILEDILDLAKTSLSSLSPDKLSITDLFVKFTKDATNLLARADEKIKSERISSSPYEAEHFLDLIRLLCQRLMRSKVVGSEADGSEADGSEAVGSEADGSEADGSEAVGSEADGSEADGSEAVGSEADGSEAVGSEVVGSEAQHFLDLMRFLVCQPLMRSEAVGSEAEVPFNAFTIPSITELHRAGVKFKVGSNENRFNIRFHTDGILEIPKIVIDDETEILFRNLLALEQCHCVHQSCYITDYINVMDCFVNTPKDVDLLVKYGIVENGLGDSTEVSTLFNKLGMGIYVSHDFTFADLSENLNKYCNSTWHRRMANLRQNYFNTPWATLSVIAAVVLLILTLIQTVCSIVSAALA